jgi:predicted DCC family thiol-disulfide oxidoreductase YuxK
MTGPAGPLLFYDGECGVCTRSVRLVLRHDRSRTLRFASLRGEHGAALFRRHPELIGLDSMVWVDQAENGNRERLLLRSAAALEVARYLGGWWRLFGVLRVVPRRVRDWCYDWFARNRHHFGGGPAACTVPRPEDRARFLDLD